MKNSIKKIIPVLIEKSFNRTHRKENNFSHSYKVVVFDGKELYIPIDCRIYWTNSRCYCCLWAYSKNSGAITCSGYAGGYGYDKESAAVGEALRNGGIILERSINGVGQSAIEDALITIAKTLYNDETLVYHLIKNNG
jgi:hypothetical protein